MQTTKSNLPLFRIENTGAEQSDVPFTFGQVFKVGALKPGAGLAAQTEGGTIPLQVDYKATHGDGSVRHAVVSGILPKLAKDDTVALQLVEVDKSKALTPIKTVTGPIGAVRITIGDHTWMASTKSVPENPAQLLSGPIVQEWIAGLPLLGPDGEPHPLLAIRAQVRWYVTGQVRLLIAIENTKTWVPASSFTYDISVTLNGSIAFEQKGVEQYHHTRPPLEFWVAKKPDIYVEFDGRYLIDSKAFSNYSPMEIPEDRELVNIAKRTAETTGFMKIGPLMADMGSAGGRGEIGPLPNFSVMWLLSMHKPAFDAMMSAANGAGSWSVHYRDEKTGYALRTDNAANKDITLHWNLREYGPLPVPRFVGNNGALGDTPYVADTAHQPSLSYLPYVVTGDAYHLENLHSFAAWNSLGTASTNHAGLGLVHWQQIRGQAWSLRTLGHAAYITPDDHPLKAYFNKQVENNLDFYYQTYVVGNPNKLGIYDSSGKNAFQVDSPATWQVAYLAWSFLYLSELGYDKALEIHKWFAKFFVGLMTDPGYCWIQAASPRVKFRDGPGMPMYDSYEALYKANFGGNVYINDNDRAYTDPDGINYIDLPCGSDAQRAFLERAHGHIWAKNRMTGYSDSSIGYASNIQPALAGAVDAGIPNAGKAWKKLSTRGAPPYYPDSPQFAIEPRIKIGASEPEPEPTPEPTPDPAPTASIELITEPSNGTWVSLGLENQTFSIDPAAIVRYGAKGKYVWAKVKGTFKGTNEFFKSDPLVGQPKYVDGFMPTPDPTPTPEPTPEPTTPAQPGDALMAKVRELLAIVDPDVTVTVTFAAKTK